jgi:hypothetical protein
MRGHGFFCQTNQSIALNFVARDLDNLAEAKNLKQIE